MQRPDYRSLIDRLNAHEIEGFRFSVQGYGHYRNCVLAIAYDEFPQFGKRVPYGVKATLAKGESATFYGKFNEGEKIFHLAGLGRKTLYDVWDRVEILEIIMKEQV